MTHTETFATALRNLARHKLRTALTMLGMVLRVGEAIAEAVPGVELVLPRVEVKAYKILAPHAKTKGKVIGISSRFPQVATVAIGEGRMFDARDEAEYAQVCVIG